MAKNGGDSRHFIFGQSPEPDGSIVTMRNSLARASHDLNVSEKQLICLAIAKINSLIAGSGDELDGLTVTVEDVMKFNQGNRKAARDLLTNAVKKLFDRVVTFNEKDLADDGEITRRTRWLYEEATHKNGSVTLFFSPRILKCLTEIRDNFTSYRVKSVMSLETKSSIRLFELLMRYGNGTESNTNGKAVLHITKEDLNLALELSASAIKAGHLKARHIEPAIVELNNKLNLNLTAVEKDNSWSFTFNVRSRIATEQAEGSVETKKLSITAIERMLIHNAKKLEDEGIDAVALLMKGQKKDG